MTHIRRDVPRCDPALLRAYEGQAAATVHEAMGRRGALDPAIKPLAADMTVCGRALTVRCHTGDNLMLVKAVSMAGPGDVIVADMGSAVASGPFGEVLAVECMARGVAGLVVSCTVRDSREIIRMGFPVFSAGLCVRGTAKATLGTINHPICIGGEIVRPGDLIVGDADGVVVVPLEEAPDILRLAEERTAKEAVVMDRLRAGESLFDIYGYQRVFDSLHCVEE
ncbi:MULTISPECIES: 4-carboxy-4-hydroxy-2-oxoadipate aldolase/oxaloacetate decarboxylase [Anaerotruncus]|uniref:Putative 4-hydroxy-4-methyl-2-oxoglutarate aldolase n=1 Tax=Anaerotruncus massiliensis (ex Togo et al. 2019) TaxID=1673720 RepID=A0ABR7ABD9_9FIRM|nr:MULTISPECIES: 4-carboxy-4-hydroxy-2-oxoadipate aldolase/oxaloacetate decarboxylase [Anaerotruncus]MBC3937773.1 4-carboxy-4-hydroxy-2-oxoadipate aldolase/oxaloacetate decarboxylase [Anaerotruncus massiliensis (ex Togo et al. 2019)]